MHEVSWAVATSTRKRKSTAASSTPDRKITDLFPAIAVKRPRAPLQDCQGPPQHQQLQQHQHQQQLKDSSATSAAPAPAASTVPKLSPASVSAPNLTPQSMALLRDFDLNWEYGPCLGISRLQRWERAAGRGLTPPPAVRSLVLAHAGNPLFTECIWLSHAGLV